MGGVDELRYTDSDPARMRFCWPAVLIGDCVAHAAAVTITPI